ncbi:MAG: NAD-dependent dihydropyrimidine dehydrogenase subunit PreA [Actinobacteria bacterium]|nr:NAD-dependent dihydropyrimidine dehydrogenase subunit PreA [Actinomycetota bacterium]
MADLSVNFMGIKSPNPFWLASAPPTNSGEQVMRAFEAGWGGAVWKTLGDPIINVSSRLGGLHHRKSRVIGMSNIELISDRPIAENLREIREVKRRYPDRAVLVSLMVESRREAWREWIKRVQDTDCDGLELNFSCPHGMAERGMGASIGQVPEYTRMITEWAKEFATVPVLVKLSPNVTDIRYLGRAAAQGGADGLALINSIASLIGVDIDTLNPIPHVRGMGSRGGYSGLAIKPIALNMVATLGADPEVTVPISGIGGISNWSDALEFILMGATTVQVCTAVMHHGYKIVEGMIDGLSDYMDQKGIARVADLVGLALPKLTDWGNLDLSYKVVARIDRERCTGCEICYVSCRDGGHQAISMAGEGRRYAQVDESRCPGCNLCSLVCPVSGCITMTEVDTGEAPFTWNQYISRTD